MGRLTTLSPQSSNRRCNAQSAALARKRGQNKRKRGKDASRAACLLCSVLEKGEVCSLEKYWKADMCPPASELPIRYFTIVMFSIAIRRGLLYFTIVNFEVPAGSVSKAVALREGDSNVRRLRPTTASSKASGTRRLNYGTFQTRASASPTPQSCRPCRCDSRGFAHVWP